MLKGQKEGEAEPVPEGDKSGAGSSPSGVRKGLRVPLGLVSHSFSSLAKHKEAERRLTDEEESLSSPQDREDDAASPNIMAKSIAGLLTTASMYVGIGDIHRAEQLATGQPETDAGADETEDEMDEAGDETGDDADAPATGTDGEEESRPVSAQESRRSTLFELSIEPHPESHTAQASRTKNRRSRMTSKLRSKFNLDDDEELVREYPCWLLRDVLIQGHIYLTSRNLLFFAFLYKSNGSARLTGNLSICNNGLSISGISGKPTRYWTVLKDHTLSLYSSSTDLYFPVLTIDLRYVTKVQHCKNNGKDTRQFHITTESKTYTFYSDNEHSARSWSSALKKQVFATQNSDNDSMSVRIPLSNIIDVEEQAIVEQGLTLRVRVMESSDSFALDDYFFMFFNNAGSQLKELIQIQVANLEMLGAANVDYARHPLPPDTEASLPAVASDAAPQDAAIASEAAADAAAADTASHSPSTNAEPRARGRSTERAMAASAYLFGRLTSPRRDDAKQLSPSKVKLRFRSVADTLKLTTPRQPGSDAPQEPEPETTILESRPRLNYWSPRPFTTMRSMWNAQPVHYAAKGMSLFADDDELMIGDEAELLAADKRFKAHFSLTDDESLVASYYTYLNRSMPLYGKIYLGKTIMCFRSLLPGSKTKMILPLHDVENCYKEQGFRFGYFGLVVVIYGHEELFFEFASQKSRDDAEYVILKIIDSLKPVDGVMADDMSAGAYSLKAAQGRDATTDAKVKLFEQRISSVGYDIPIMVEDNPFYKTTITPKKFYTFGMLTIGSRGDVQPYIALGKGLLQEGHRVVVISHAEFGDWVRSHGLQFRAIAGDPAELMALMVQHGSMNVGLIREAASTFRNWIRDLLETAWEACQGIDVLIESPSAMAGIHIAEALQIPYFRAFTMPWTKTRSYPHAFIVPDQKRGGNYNYFTHVLFENIFWKGINSQVNRWRVEKLGLKKTNLEFMQQGKVPFLYNMSPTVFPPSVDFAEWIKVTGYWFLNESSNYVPPQALLEFMAKARRLDKKLVYIGFGSIVVKDPVKMTMAVVEAVVKADVYCILNKGWSARLGGQSQKSIEVQLPNCVYDAGNVPHDWLFPRVDAAVHHGGSGTTGATMRAGVPTVIKPFFGDQYFYANRIEDIGAGIALRKLNACTLSRALKEVTTNTRIIAKAKKIGQDISKEDGVATAIAFIYSEMAYAKSLIKAKRQEDKKAAKEAKQIQNEDSWLLL